MVMMMIVLMSVVHHSNAALICEDGMHQVPAFTSSGYHVRCCEPSVYGEVCNPPIPGIDFSVRCRDMGFPNMCNCGQFCVGKVHKNKTCTGPCTCLCNTTTITTTAPTTPIIDGGTRNNNYYIIGIFLGAAMCSSFLFALLVYTKSVTFITMSISGKRMDIEEGGDIEKTL